MDTQIIAIFCLCEDPQCQMSDAKVMTIAIVAMLYFKGNFSFANRFLLEADYIPGMLSRSRFNRRIISDPVFAIRSDLDKTQQKLVIRDG